MERVPQVAGYDVDMWTWVRLKVRTVMGCLDVVSHGVREGQRLGVAVHVDHAKRTHNFL